MPERDSAERLHDDLHRTRELLECTELFINQISARTGLGTAATLRHHFRRKVGLSPAEYRRQFFQAERMGSREWRRFPKVI
jgi:AraC family transcriptional activator FtrA